MLAGRRADRTLGRPGNDAGTEGDWTRHIDRPHLRVFVAQPAYLLALKAAAMRIGPGFHDIEDVRFLLRLLDITRLDEALATITRYIPETQLQPKVRFALAELLAGYHDKPA